MKIYINDIIDQVTRGEITIEQSVAMIDELNMQYAIKFFNASSVEQNETYLKIFRAWKKINQPEVIKLADPVKIKCDCGHFTTKNTVMAASIGTSCPDCYDRMSD